MMSVEHDATIRMRCIHHFLGCAQDVMMIGTS